MPIKPPTKMVIHTPMCMSPRFTYLANFMPKDLRRKGKEKLASGHANLTGVSLPGDKRRI